MQITINTPTGEIKFDMSEATANEIAQLAMKYSAACKEKENKTEQTSREKRMHRRVDSLFGNFKNYSQGKEQDDFRNQELPFPEEHKHKGFLLIKCEKCGELRGYCAKNPISEHRCSCGHYTKIGNLKIAYLHCECGASYRYKTNMEDETFEYTCMNCGSPIDLQLNKKRGTYMTMRDERA